MFSLASVSLIFFLYLYMVSSSGGVVKVFVGLIGLTACLGFGLWGSGENLKGLALFLVVVGSLMSIFGFLLCLIPWKIGSGESLGSVTLGGAVVGTLLLLGALFLGDFLVGEEGSVFSGSGGMSGGLGEEVGVVLGVLLFVVMVLVVSFGSLSKGTLRRC